APPARPRRERGVRVPLGAQGTPPHVPAFSARLPHPRDGRVGRRRRGALLRRRAVRARADPDLVHPRRPPPAGGRARMTPLLDVHCLSKTYHDGTLPVVNGLSFEVAEGELFALLGPSGCGKTTALR